MRTYHPLYVFLAALVCVLVSVLLAPVFPEPVSTLIYWSGFIAALALVVVGVHGLVDRSR